MKWYQHQVSIETITTPFKRLFARVFPKSSAPTPTPQPADYRSYYKLPSTAPSDSDDRYYKAMNIPPRPGPDYLWSPPRGWVKSDEYCLPTGGMAMMPSRPIDPSGFYYHISGG